MRKQKLTLPQICAAEDIREFFGGERIGPSRKIYPSLIWPARNNRDNGLRRACEALARKGLLIHHPDYPEAAIVYYPTAELWEALARSTHR